jgi:hypothetical protein
MSYIINNSRGQVVAVVADGTINTTSTDLALVGRGVSGYGTSENENYVFLLENFANGTAPLQPILGQLWYNSSTNILSAYNSANAWTALATQANIESAKINPAFTGIPTAPTAAPGTNTTQLATTAFVTSSPAFTGIPTAPTAAPGTNTTQLATTAFVTNSAALAGTPTAPTAAPGTNTTQLATTAFVTLGPQFSGIPTAPTAIATDNSTQLATTAFVQAQKSNMALLGVSTAPTAASGTNTTQIATTEFVQSEKNSPAFTGVPTAPNALPGTNTDQLATTAFVVSTVTGGSSILGTMAQQAANAVIITGGTISGLSAPIEIASGGTGSSTAAGARSLLGLGSMSVQNAGAVAISGGTITGIAPLPILSGGTGAGNASDARTSLGLGSMSVQNAGTVAITGGSISGITPLPLESGGTGASDAGAARSQLGLGSMATQSATTVNISGGSVNNVQIDALAVALPVTAGGTGGSSAFVARTNLGLGSLATQNLSDVNITGGTITGISPLPVNSGGTGGNDVSSARLNLGLGTMALQSSTNVDIAGGNISGLTNPLSIVNGGTGATSNSAARIALGLGTGATTDVGTIATQNANNVNITGGAISALSTPLPVAAGGTGASDPVNARTLLGAAAEAVIISAGTGLAGGGDLSTSRTLSIATNSNGFGVRTISTLSPTGGNNGDIWYQV